MDRHKASKVALGWFLMLTDIIKPYNINLAIIIFMVLCVRDISGEKHIDIIGEKKCFQKFCICNFKISLGLNYFLRKSFHINTSVPISTNYKPK
jgi:hypothetical protein